MYFNGLVLAREETEEAWLKLVGRGRKSGCCNGAKLKIYWWSVVGTRLILFQVVLVALQLPSKLAEMA